MFTLYEELLMLSIHEDKGMVIGISIERLKLGLVGAIMAELALMGKIRTSDTHRLQLVDDSQASNEILDEAIGFFKNTKKEHKVGYWIDTLNKRTEKIRRRITGSLIQKGVLTQDDDRLHWAMPTPLQENLKASSKYWMIKRLRGIVLAQEEMQLRDIVLLSLVRACGLLDLIFLRDERKLADRYINEQIFSQSINDSNLQTVQEIEIAITDMVDED